jgi:transcriptional regulator
MLPAAGTCSRAIPLPTICRLGTVGLRIPISRFICKLKLSQDKDPLSRSQVMERLRAPGPYCSPGLAQDMERVLNEGPA